MIDYNGFGFFVQNRFLIRAPNDLTRKRGICKFSIDPIALFVTKVSTVDSLEAP